jgi:predicted HAD superfamily Cof-like phosphohydrolase
MTNFAKVREFMVACDQDVETVPGFPDPDTAFLRVKLIREELKELEQAIVYKDIVGVADGLADLLYVVYGAGHTFGINLDKCFEEVHRSNMTKLGPDGRAIKNSYGKVMKGPNYREPNLKRVLSATTVKN